MRNYLSLIFICGLACNPIHGLKYNDPELNAVIIDDEAVLDPEVFEPTDVDSTTQKPDGYCTTSAGIVGKCITSGACYPYAAYFVGDENEKDFTTALQEIFNSTEPCLEGHDLVCCPDYSYGLPNKRPSILPQFTRPPGSGPPSTTAATPTTDSTTKGTEAPASKATCGLSYTSNDGTNPKVVGGRTAAIGEFPWAVALLNNGRQFCGGSLINKDYILTAAHCVQGLTQTNGIRINVGDHDLSSNSEARHESRGASKILYHRGFSMSNLRDDIALIKLSSPVTFTNSIQPVCLNTDELAAGTRVDLAGWGKTGNYGRPSSTLRTNRMPIISPADCRAQYSGTSAPPLTSGMICAGERATLKDACNGDSGGPLTYSDVNGTGKTKTGKQVGVVSWGIGCGEKPGVYTKVSNYLPWIGKNAV